MPRLTGVKTGVNSGALLTVVHHSRTSKTQSCSSRRPVHGSASSIGMFQFSSLVPNPFASRYTPSESADPPQPPPAMTEDAGPLPPAFPFMRLPLELREQVYSHYFHPGDHLVRNPVLEAKGFYGGVYQWDLDVFYVNKQIYRESKRVWDRENIFVKIATPWPTAGMYQVYLMATDGVSEQGSMSMSESSSGHRELPLLLQAKSENKSLQVKG